jgi:hypothetical protein
LPPPRCCRYCQQSFQPSKYRPDQSVCSQTDCQRRRNEYHRQWRSWSLSFEYDDLLPQSKDLKRGIQAITKESAERAEECRDQIEHE